MTDAPSDAADRRLIIKNSRVFSLDDDTDLPPRKTIVIEDGRRRRLRSFVYSDGASSLYEYCADARSRADISARFDEEAWVEPALNEFLERELIVFLDGRYLSLALPENAYF